MFLAVLGRQLAPRRGGSGLAAGGQGHRGASGEGRPRSASLVAFDLQPEVYSEAEASNEEQRLVQLVPLLQASGDQAAATSYQAQFDEYQRTQVELDVSVGLVKSIQNRAEEELEKSIEKRDRLEGRCEDAGRPVRGREALPGARQAPLPRPGEEDNMKRVV